MNIVFLDANTINPNEINLEKFNDFGNFTYFDRTSTADLVIQRAKNAEILLTNKTIISEQILDQLPHLKYIGVTATGYNIVDVAAAKKRGIVVCNAAGYSTASVAQQTIAMILAFANRLTEHSRFNNWASQPDFCYYNFSLQELAGKKLGLVGFGETAQATARIAQALGMQISIYKPSNLTENPMNVIQTDFETLLKESDYLSLHCPLTAHNQQMMNMETFKKMKSTAILINTARGGLINESDLKEALETDIIAGAYLDVLTTEPPAASHIFANTKNLKISPHIAWASLAARQRLIKIVYENIQNYLEGKPRNVVI